MNAMNELIERESSVAMVPPGWKQVTIAKLHHRVGPWIGTFAMMAMGMAIMFAWDPLFRHTSSWLTPGDVWEIFRGAHFVGWGYVGGIYSPGTGIVSFPGMSVVLAPIAMISGSFGLTESYSPYFLAHPSAAYLLQPAELLLTASVLFPVDALAERFGVDQRKRAFLTIGIVVLALPVAALWGHAEDALAMTFGIYGLIAMMDGKWSRCGWLLGFGIAMQPLLAVTVPLLVCAAPQGERLRMAVRSAALSCILLGIAFAGDATDTFRAVVKQPSDPTINHVTPWISLAPRLPSNPIRVGQAFASVRRNGHEVLTTMPGHLDHPVLVAGGPGRTIYIGLAFLLGIYVLRRPQPMLRVIWLAAAILACRCLFEAVMCPYYLAPPLFLALAMTSRMGRGKFYAAVLASVGVSGFAYFNLNPWLWWIPIVFAMAGILALGFPPETELSAAKTDRSENAEIGCLESTEVIERESVSLTREKVPDPFGLPRVRKSVVT